MTRPPSYRHQSGLGTQNGISLNLEIRNPKSETNPKSEFLNVQNNTDLEPKSEVLVIWILKIWKLFRVSIFGLRIFDGKLIGWS
jgi:hypothetical protein